MEQLHIAIILDGNRRFAKKKSFLPWKGHEEGVKNVENLLGWCRELGNIRELSLYVFSIENFNRTKDEINYLFNLFENEFEKFSKNDYLEKYQVRYNFIGRREMFSKKIQNIMKTLEEKSKKYKNHAVNIAMGYGGRSEIVDSAKKLSIDVKNGIIKPEEINEELFSKYLYLDSEPDILIRTGGDYRISNFLLWQSNYTELFFINKMWPEFNKKDFENVITEFHNRERRFGK